MFIEKIYITIKYISRIEFLFKLVFNLTLILIIYLCTNYILDF